MKLIRKLGTRINKNGTRISYGEFLCSFDNKIVIRQLGGGKRDLSCGCQKNKAISVAISGEKHPLYGKHRTEETKQKIRKANSGEKHPLYGKHLTEEQKYKQSEKMIGVEFTEEHRQKISKAKKGKTKGQNNPNWQGGKSFEEYPQEFNKELKKQILRRDTYTCKFPNCNGIHDRLHVHHIDYNKQNNNPENLITLGNSCHMKTNFNRIYWAEFFKNILIGKNYE